MPRNTITMYVAFAISLIASLAVQELQANDTSTRASYKIIDTSILFPKAYTFTAIKKGEQLLDIQFPSEKTENAATKQLIEQYNTRTNDKLTILPLITIEKFPMQGFQVFYNQSYKDDLLTYSRVADIPYKKEKACTLCKGIFFESHFCWYYHQDHASSPLMVCTSCIFNKLIREEGKYLYNKPRYCHLIDRYSKDAGMEKDAVPNDLTHLILKYISSSAKFQDDIIDHRWGKYIYPRGFFHIKNTNRYDFRFCNFSLSFSQQRKEATLLYQRLALQKEITALQHAIANESSAEGVRERIRKEEYIREKKEAASWKEKHDDKAKERGEWQERCAKQKEELARCKQMYTQQVEENQDLENALKDQKDSNDEMAMNKSTLENMYIYGTSICILMFAVGALNYVLFKYKECVPTQSSPLSESMAQPIQEKKVQGTESSANLPLTERV